LKNKKIIIVGGNAAGPAAAAKAKRSDPNSEVILFEKSKFISTGTCELPYILSGEIKNYKDIIFYDSKSFKEEKGVTVYTEYLVTELNRKQKEIYVKCLNTGNNLKFDYDKLILTTGAKVKPFPIFSKDYENIFTLKSVENFLSINNYINTNSVKKVIIIGSGYIGIETAEALNSLGLEVTIIEKFPYPMPQADIEISNLVNEKLQRNKINFYGNVSAFKFSVKDNKVNFINIDSRLIETDMVVLSIGFLPNIDLAVSSKIELGKTGAIKLNNRLQTSDYNIYAAGDNSEVLEYVSNNNMYIPLATIAHSMGHIAGDNAAGGNSFMKPIVRNTAVKIFDTVFAQAGLTESELKQKGIKFNSVSSIHQSLVHVMPNSRKIFGKIIYEINNNYILGASFFGGQESIGYADMISLAIRNKVKVTELKQIDFNYTPPNSPFINIISILSRKVR